MEKITLQDIAKELGITKGTVDRAIHNRPDVSAETREKVLKLIAKYQYKPNKVARSLSLRSAKTRVGVILQNNPAFYWDNVKKGIRTAEQELTDFGLEVIVKELQKGRAADEILQRIDELAQEKVDAIILVPINDQRIRDKVNQVSRDGIKVATLNDDISDSERFFYMGPQIRRSGRAAAELMGRFLKTGGRVLTVNGNIQSLEYQERLEGFNELLREKYPEVKVIANYTYDYEEMSKTGDLVLKNLIEASDKIDGIYDVDGASLYNIGKILKECEKQRNIVLIGHEISSMVRELLEDGTIHACISQDPFSQGYFTLKLLYDYLVEGKKPLSDRMYVRLDIIMKENFTDQENVINPYHA